MSRLHAEKHLVQRIGWLRAAVLGANDGIVSTASLIVGVAAASQGRSEILVAGLAGLVAGAMSMAAGEYVSVRAPTWRASGRSWPPNRSSRLKNLRDSTRPGEWNEAWPDRSPRN
jgi:VIT1/CCC1 family predicted Fe2+/Mn2+ transporter